MGASGEGHTAGGGSGDPPSARAPWGGLWIRLLSIWALGLVSQNKTGDKVNSDRSADQRVPGSDAKWEHICG